MLQLRARWTEEPTPRRLYRYRTASVKTPLSHQQHLGIKGDPTQRCKLSWRCRTFTNISLCRFPMVACPVNVHATEELFSFFLWIWALQGQGVATLVCSLLMKNTKWLACGVTGTSAINAMFMTPQTQTVTHKSDKMAALTKHSLKCQQHFFFFFFFKVHKSTKKVLWVYFVFHSQWYCHHASSLEGSLKKTLPPPDQLIWALYWTKGLSLNQSKNCSPVQRSIPVDSSKTVSLLNTPGTQTVEREFLNKCGLPWCSLLSCVGASFT